MGQAGKGQTDRASHTTLLKVSGKAKDSCPIWETLPNTWLRRLKGACRSAPATVTVQHLLPHAQASTLALLGSA